MGFDHNKMMVVTCLKCRSWYNMDYEEHLDDEHYNMRTGQVCIAGDGDWAIHTVDYRKDWAVAR